jgi:histone demethylase JARID1
VSKPECIIPYHSVRDYKLEVEYAADLPANKYGSGFPTTTQSRCRDQFFEYHTNLFNLNNTYKSSDSLLRISSIRNEKISGVTIPWIYLGMKFSSFCWHVEDLYINSLNYNHKGSSKIWYIIPGAEKERFDEFVRKLYNKQLSSKPDFMHRITLMIDPLEIIKAGIKLYKINHTPRSYVFTFPKVYHAGFSTGFNMGEAVNFLSHRNISAMKEAYKEYAKFGGKKAAIFPFDWLIYENYMSQNKFETS